MLLNVLGAGLGSSASMVSPETAASEDCAALCAARKAEEGLGRGRPALLAALGGSLLSCEVLLGAESLAEAEEAPLPLALAVAAAVLLAEATGATPVLLAFSAVSGWSPEALGAVVTGLFLLAAAVGSIPGLGLGAAEVPEGLTFLAAAAAADRLAAMAVVRWEAVGGGTAVEPGRPEDDPGGRVAPEEAPEVGREVEAVVVVVEVERGERLLTEAAVPVEGTVRAAGRG